MYCTCNEGSYKYELETIIRNSVTKNQRSFKEYLLRN